MEVNLQYQTIIYHYGELETILTCSISDQIDVYGKKREVKYYNLDMISIAGEK